MSFETPAFLIDLDRANLRGERAVAEWKITARGKLQ